MTFPRFNSRNMHLVLCIYISIKWITAQSAITSAVEWCTWDALCLGPLPSTFMMYGYTIVLFKYLCNWSRFLNQMCITFRSHMLFLIVLVFISWHATVVWFYHSSYILCYPICNDVLHIVLLVSVAAVQATLWLNACIFLLLWYIYAAKWTFWCWLNGYVCVLNKK